MARLIVLAGRANLYRTYPDVGCLLVAYTPRSAIHYLLGCCSGLKTPRLRLGIFAVLKS